MRTDSLNLTLYWCTGNQLSALVTFDREEKKSYQVQIAITDSGQPTQTGTSTLTVVIGDENDNPMKKGSSDIFVYNYKVRASVSLSPHFSIQAYDNY